MAIPKRQSVELINVHRVIGDKDAIIFLKNADHDVVEGWFYQAKHYGHAQFQFQGLNYDITRNRDFSFTIKISEEQTLSAEEFS